MADHMRSQLVVDAPLMAVARRRRHAPEPPLRLGPSGCDTCASCRLGTENCCGTSGGVGDDGLDGIDGGMAPYMVVPSTRFPIR
jgi:hypothetical protein